MRYPSPAGVPKGWDQVVPGHEFVLGLAFAYVCLDLWWTASVGNAMAGDSIEGPGPECRTIREEALPTTH